MVGLFKYLTGGYCGKMMPKNAVEHVCHVHIVVNTINRDGDDMYFLVKKKGLYISDIRGTPSVNGKKLTSGMLKSYLKSVQLISTFVHHGLLVEKHFRISNAKICSSPKVARKLQQNHTLPDFDTKDHKRGEEAMTAFKDEDINHFYKCERTRKARKVLGEASGGDAIISDSKFTLARDYQKLSQSVLSLLTF